MRGSREERHMASSKGSTRIVQTIARETRGSTALLILDNPASSLNVIDERVLADLRTRFDEIAGDPSITAVVLASGKRGSFGAGADVSWLPELAGRDDAERFLASVHGLMQEIVQSPLPWVTAVDGPALGGALELALAGDGIVATPSARLGLPEITLGLIPGGGGTQLIGRWVPTGSALDLLLGGTVLTAEQALAIGLVTEIAEPDGLVDAAVALAGTLGRKAPVEQSHEDRLAEIEARTASAPTLAARRLLEVVSAGVEHGPEAGYAAERSAFLELIPSDEAAARIHLFTAESEVKRRSRSSASPVERLGVVGGGQMGSGIAATAVSRGIKAVVRDVTEDQLAKAGDYLDRVLARSAGGEAEAAERRADWAGTTEWDGFDRVSAVIEAVFELPELKLETLGQIAERVGPDTLVATNTSAIPVGSLAGALKQPGQFMGMHFFSPVDRMPLVELVPHSATEAATVERAGGLARQLGKVPIVVADLPGFFTSRVYARWLIEGILLLLDGAAPATIEAAAKSAGFPVGPLQASDEATLDLVLKASVTQVAEKVMATRLDIAAVRSALERLIAAGVEGRRQGSGFYSYEGGKRAGLNPAVGAVLGVDERELDERTVRDRLLLAFASECFLCWDDGTLCHPDDGDVGSVLGIGFPRALGGPFHWADRTGLAWVAERSDELGPIAFPVGTTLPRLAASGGRFADEPRRAAPGTGA